MGGGFSLFLAFACLWAGDVYDYQDTVARGNLPQVDGIVCLAGGRGRIGLAGDIWLQYQEMSQVKKSKTVPVLYLAGMGPQVHWLQVIKQFKPQVQKVIGPENVFIENESSNTVANAVWLAEFARKKNWHQILLLTSSYHMKRAQLIFEKVLKTRGNSVQLDTLSVYQDPFSRAHWRYDTNGMRVTLFEYVKSLYYRFVWRGE